MFSKDHNEEIELSEENPNIFNVNLSFLLYDNKLK